MLQNSYRKVGAAALAACIALSLAACAPEPEEAVVHGKNPMEQGEAKHPEPPEEAFEKTTEVPESFPQSFPRPAGVTVNDTGEREPGVWFIVFEAPDQAAADTAWQTIIADGGFTVSESAETAEGGVSATLTSSELTVTGMTMPVAGSETVLLSYDITSVPL